MTEYFKKEELLKLKKGDELFFEYRNRRVSTCFGGGANSKSKERIKIDRVLKTKIVYTYENGDLYEIKLNDIHDDHRGAIIDQGSNKIRFIKIPKKISRFALISKG